jgi:hypothetical protein
MFREIAALGRKRIKPQPLTFGLQVHLIHTEMAGNWYLLLSCTRRVRVGSRFID